MAASTPAVAKDRFTALDTLALVREIRALPIPRVEKAFALASGGWSLALKSPGEGRRELVMVPGRYAALAGEAEHAAELDPLARELRRLLTGTRLSGAAEPGGERYLELEFLAAAADPPFVLAVELFGSGNLVVARAGRILAVQHPRTWAHRSVRVGASYERPPSRTDPWRSSVAEIGAALVGSRTDRATTLAARLALGGPVAEEVLARAGLAGSESAAADATRSAEAIHRSIEGILADIGDRPAGHLYRRGEFLADVEPFPSERFRADPSVSHQPFASFSEAALAFFPGIAPSSPVSRAARPSAPAEDLSRQRDRQRTAVAELEEAAARAQADGEALLERYSEAESALEKAGRAAGDGAAPVEIVVGGRAVSVRPGRSVRECAQALFEESKRVRAKLAGARSALADTERRIELELLREPEAAKGPGGREPAVRPPHWFERFRWFLSSERLLVIGGRDASSNDRIVRRYLNPGDRYVHAEIQGAPSVIVKHPPPGTPPASEATMEEAGQWGVAFSKAWKAGLASASAFWVESDQVSKSGASGEFVPRGAWENHGTKNRMKDLPLELAIGTVGYEGDELWTVAPRRAMEKVGQPRFVLVPGEERERADLEVELARELGLSRTRIQGLLPAGGVSIRRA